MNSRTCVSVVRSYFGKTGVAIIILVVLAACQQAEPTRPGEPLIEQVDGQAEVVIGPRTTEVLGNPTTVRAYRVLSSFAPNFAKIKKTKPLIDVYPILAEAPVSADVAQSIAKILLDPASYDPKYAMACLFEPGHALRFERGADSVDVIVCFKCSDLDIIPSKRLGEKRTTQPFGAASGPLYDAFMKISPSLLTPVSVKKSVGSAVRAMPPPYGCRAQRGLT